MKITLIGHSTVLIELAGQRMLTDPYFGTWGNPAYARVAPPAYSREMLVDVDLVLLSHLHWDHVDRAFLRSLAPEVPVLVPPSRSWLAALKGARFPVPLRPWQQHRHRGVTITAVPARHMARTVGYVLCGEDRCLYFAGDTYCGSFMSEIGRRFPIDVALMPVTTYRVPMTMGERGAVEAVRRLLPTTVIPIHLGLQPRSPLLRTSHTVAGFQERLSTASCDTRTIELAPGQAWDGTSDPWSTQVTAMAS